MAPPRTSLPSPPSESSSSSSSSGGGGGSSSTVAMLLLLMGYVFALSEKLHVEFKNLYTAAATESDHHPNSSRSDTPPTSSASALEPSRQRHDEEELRVPSTQDARRQQKPRRGGVSSRLEFSVAAFLRKFSSQSSSSSSSSSPGALSSSRRSARARKQQEKQQQSSRAPAFAAPSAGSDETPPAAAARRRCSEAATAWAPKVRLGSSGVVTQQQGQGLLPDSAPTSRARRTDKALCLDLDETLIHARGDIREMGENRFDFMLVLPARGRQQSSTAVAGEGKWRGAGGEEGVAEKGAGGKGRRIFVRKRPYLKEFLEAASEMFEVVLFTAAPAEFAQAVVEQLDPEGKLVDYVLSRESCTRLKVDGSSGNPACKGRGRGERGPTSMVKDLDVVGRPLSKVIMVDNSLDAIRYQLENGVHISSFYGNREDTGLLSTLEALKALAPLSDVRDGIIRLSVETQARKEGHTLMPDGSISSMST